MIFAVGNDYRPVRSDGDRFNALKLAVSGAPGTEGRVEATVRVEDLNAVVAAVCDDDEALVVYAHTARIFELTVVETFRSKCKHHMTVVIENLKYSFAATKYLERVTLLRSKEPS